SGAWHTSCFAKLARGVSPPARPIMGSGRLPRPRPAFHSGDTAIRCHSRIAFLLSKQARGPQVDRVNQALVGQLQFRDWGKTKKREGHEWGFKVAPELAGGGVQTGDALDHFLQ